MRELLDDPKARLAARAAVAAGVAAYAVWQTGNHGYQALIVAGALAFCEVFTPLNSLVGLFKKPQGARAR